MALPIKRTGQLRSEEPKLKALIAGPPGSGKTLFGSTWPDVLYLSAEGGLLVLQERDLPYMEIEESADLNKARLALDQDRKIREQLVGFDVKTVVLDTVDEIQRMLSKERLLEQHQDTMTQQDWGWLLDQMRSIVRGFRNLDLNVIFTCHVKEDKDDEGGRIHVHPQLQGAFSGEITASFDLALLLRASTKSEAVDGGKRARRTIERFLQTYPDANHDWIKDRSGKLPPEFRLDFASDYDRMAKLIFGQTVADDSPAAQQAEQAAVLTSADVKAAAAAKKAEKGSQAAQKAKEKAPEPTPEPSADESPASEPEPDAPDAPAADDEAKKAELEQARKVLADAEAAAKAKTEPEASAPEPKEADESEKAPPKPARIPSKATKPKASAQPKAEKEPEKEETGSQVETPAEGDNPVCVQCSKTYEETKLLKNLRKLFKEPLCSECVGICEVCGEQEPNLQQIEFGGIRYRRRLCKAHFKEAGTGKKAS